MPSFLPSYVRSATKVMFLSIEKTWLFGAV